jgi:hypothetical protein
MQRCKDRILLIDDLEGNVCDLTEIVSLNPSVAEENHENHVGMSGVPG